MLSSKMIKTIMDGVHRNFSLFLKIIFLENNFIIYSGFYIYVCMYVYISALERKITNFI